MVSETMVGFGSKQSWLAVRDGDPAAIRATLGLRDLGPVAWRAGVDLAYLTDDRLIVTPPVSGWVLVAGRWWWRTADLHPVARLSADLGAEVQRYATHRGLERHSWERAVDGVLVRAFAYDGATGEVDRWIGDPDAAELAVGLPTEPEEDVLLGEADVMRLAGMWSVDPTSLDGRPAPAPLHAAAAAPDL